MIDFEMELKKFRPVLGVEIGDNEMFDDDVKDITDLVAEMVEELKETDNR